MKNRLLLLAATALVAVGVAAGPAKAGLVLTLDDFDGTTHTTVTGVTIVNGGAVGFLGSDTAFGSVSVNISGVPLVPSPDLGLVSLDVSAGSGFTGTHVLTITALQTGLTGFNGGVGDVTATYNGLIGSSGPVTANAFFNGASIATNTFSPGTAVQTYQSSMFLAGVADPFTDALQFVMTFNAAQQDVQVTAEFKTADAPEPASLAVLGIGLLGLGFTQYRRRA